jgi:hypothetical protein
VQVENESGSSQTSLQALKATPAPPHLGFCVRHKLGYVKARDVGLAASEEEPLDTQKKVVNKIVATGGLVATIKLEQGPHCVPDDYVGWHWRDVIVDALLEAFA